MKKVLLLAATIGVAMLLHDCKEARADKPCSVPAAWGPLRGVTFSTNTGAWNSASLYLEDAQGVIRQVRADNCKLTGEISRN